MKFLQRLKLRNHRMSRSLCTPTPFVPPVKTYYDDLEIESDATNNEIKEAYITLTKMYHPDANLKDQNPEITKEKFKNITDAYNILGNPRSRRDYDRGTLGRDSSVADVELAKHKFEGENMYRNRSKIKDFYNAKSIRDVAQNEIGNIIQSDYKNKKTVKMGETNIVSAKLNSAYKGYEIKALEGERLSFGGGGTRSKRGTSKGTIGFFPKIMLVSFVGMLFIIIKNGQNT